MASGVEGRAVLYLVVRREGRFALNPFKVVMRVAQYGLPDVPQPASASRSYVKERAAAVRSVANEDAPVKIRHRRYFRDGIPMDIFFRVEAINERCPLGPLVPALHVLNGALVGECKFCYGVLLVYLFTFRNRYLTMFQDVAFTKLRRVIALLGGLRAIIPRDRRFVNYVRGRNDHRLICQQFIARYSGLTVNSPATAMRQVVRPGTLVRLDNDDVLFGGATAPDRQRVREYIAGVYGGEACGDDT